jgi:hypothetical protein
MANYFHLLNTAPLPRSYLNISGLGDGKAGGESHSGITRIGVALDFKIF